MILAGVKWHRSEGAARATEHPPSQLSALLQPQQQGLGTGQTPQRWFPFPAACCTPPLLLQEGQCSNETQEQLVLLKRTALLLKLPPGRTNPSLQGFT